MQPIKQIGVNNGVPQPRALAVAIISLVATIGGGILAVKQTQQQNEGLALQQEIAQTQLELEREQTAQNTIAGIPKGVFYGLIGLVALVMIIIAIRK